MEDILFTIVIIVAIICYTIYKIDCNHVNKPKNNYPTGGLSGHRSLEKKPASDELKEYLKHKAEENRKDSE
jgi:hypothetical protein